MLDIALSKKSLLSRPSHRPPLLILPLFDIRLSLFLFHYSFFGFHRVWHMGNSAFTGLTLLFFFLVSRKTEHIAPNELSQDLPFHLPLALFSFSNRRGTWARMLLVSFYFLWFHLLRSQLRLDYGVLYVRSRKFKNEFEKEYNQRLYIKKKANHAQNLAFMFPFIFQGAAAQSSCSSSPRAWARWTAAPRGACGPTRTARSGPGWTRA